MFKAARAQQDHGSLPVTAPVNVSLSAVGGYTRPAIPAILGQPPNACDRFAFFHPHIRTILFARQPQVKYLNNVIEAAQAADPARARV